MVGRLLWVCSVHCAWEGYGVSHCIEAAHPGDESFDAEAETAVGHRAVPSGVEVVVVVVGVFAVVSQSAFDLVDVGFSLAPPDDFSVAFWCEEVASLHGVGVVWDFFHVERFGFLGVVRDDDRRLVELCEDSFFVAAEVFAPADVDVAFVFEDVECFRVGHAGEVLSDCCF